MKQTHIYFWNGISKDVPYKHGEEVDYMQRYHIVEELMNSGYNVMLRNITDEEGTDKLIIFIDKGRFVQS